MDENKNEDGVKSPFVPEINNQFDYNKYQDDTTIKAISELFKCLGKNSDIIVFPHSADKKDMIDNYDKVANEMLNILIDFKVPTCDLQKVSDELSNIPFQLFQIISRLRNEYEKELLARTIGTRNPGDGKYSSEYATVGDMINALINVRKSQGNNAEDYFFIDKKSE